MSTCVCASAHTHEPLGHRLELWSCPGAVLDPTAVDRSGAQGTQDGNEGGEGSVGCWRRLSLVLD